MNRQGIRILPRFMGEDGEHFFTLQFACIGSPKAHIVFVPPFGEEMNRCRSLVAQQARKFAEAGYACTLVDFYGCGDSQGELHDASLAIWQNNIRDTIETLQREICAPVVLWGLRLGAFIALDFASNSALPIDTIILWQPVISGERYVTQILRQRVASLAIKNLPPETTAQIRQRLAEGARIEISGYTIGGQLMQDVEGLSLECLSALCSGKIHWLENVSEVGSAVTMATSNAVEQLKSLENEVVVHTFAGQQVWQVHERSAAPELIFTTSSLLP